MPVKVEQEAIKKGGIMPKALEEKLMRQANKLKLSKYKKGAYVFGTLQKIQKGIRKNASSKKSPS